MKFETNLFLRALIGEKKSRLLEEDARIPLRCSPEDADRIIQINQELKVLNSALSELKEEEKKQDNPSTTPIEAPAPRPTDKDIERIRYELDRAITIADNVNDHILLIRRYPTLGTFSELFLAEIAALLRSVSNARTKFDAAYPEKSEQK